MKLDSIEPNLMDVVWHDQPVRKFNPILALDTSFTGRTTGDKVGQIRHEMKGNKCTALVITALDEVACKYQNGKPNPTQQLAIPKLQRIFCLRCAQGYSICVAWTSIIIQYSLAMH